MNNTVFPGILHKNRPLPALLLGLALGLTGKVHGWEGEELFLADLPVYLTVTRLPQNITEMPAAVTIIDRAMIAASGAVEITDLFRLVPGFQVGHYHDTDGSRTVVTAHGFTDQYARRLQVLIDGFSVYKPSTGGAEWHDLPLSLDDIERIEVIRGPNAASYGANSVNGVINIITRHPSSQLSTRLSTTLGERQYRQYGLRHGERFGDMDLRVSAEYIRDTGLVNVTDPDWLNDDMRTRHINLRAEYRAGINDYLSVQLGGGNGDRQVGNDQDLFNPVRDKKMENHHQFLGWKRLFDTDTEVQLQLSHQLHRIDDRIAIAISDELAIIDDHSIKAERYSVDLSHRVRLNELTRLVWGGELRQDKVGAGSYLGPGNEYTLNSQNLYFNMEWRPAPAWIYNLGNMTEHSKTFGTHHSPRIAVNYLIGGGHYLRTAAGRAYRMPAFLEEKGDYALYDQDGQRLQTLIISDGNMHPEKQDSIELAVGMERTTVGYDLRLFRSRTTDAIDTARNMVDGSEPDKFFNDGGIDINGLEFQLRIEPDDKTRLHMGYAHASAEGQVIHRFDPEELLPRVYHDEENSVPEDSLSLLLDREIDRRQQVGVGFYYVSSMKLLSGAERHTGRNISAIDVNYRRRFHAGQMQGQWSLMYRDLNGAYFTVSNRVWRDRQGFFRLSVEF